MTLNTDYDYDHVTFQITHDGWTHDLASQLHNHYNSTRDTKSSME